MDLGRKDGGLWGARLAPADLIDMLALAESLPFWFHRRMQSTHLPAAPQKSLIERAFELAHSGQYGSMREIVTKLTAEGYLGVESKLVGPMLRKQLRAAWLAAGKRRVQ